MDHARRELRDVLIAFARTLTARYDVAHVLDELTAHTVEVLGAAGAGVSLGDPSGALRYVTASSDEVTKLELTQEEHQAGPGWEAFRSGRPVVVPDIEPRQDWPEYRAACGEIDMRSVAGIPMTWNGLGFGALDIYRREPAGWTETEADTAGVLADMAASYVAHASQLDDARRLNEQLQEALDSRVLIEQAKGLIAGERGITLGEAYEVLRRQARSNHASLRSVSAAVVEAGFRP